LQNWLFVPVAVAAAKKAQHSVQPTGGIHPAKKSLFCSPTLVSVSEALEKLGGYLKKDLRNLPVCTGRILGVEREERNISIENLSNIAKALNIFLSELLQKVDQISITWS
jgi:hypothetical protein